MATRIKKRRTGAYTLTVRAVDEAGQPLTVSSPTVKVYDALEREIATGTPTPDGDSLVFELAIDKVPVLGRYSAVFGGTVSGKAEEWEVDFEIVGGFPFELVDLRDLDDELEDTTEYPDAELRRARTWAEERFEHPKSAAVAFVPRGAIAKLRGDGTTTLVLPHPALRRVTYCAIAGTELTTDELAALDPYEDGRVYRAAGWPAGVPVTIQYEHGYDEPSGPVVAALLLLAKEYATKDTLGSRNVAESSDLGFYRLSIAQPGGKTGIPEVDAVMEDNNRRRQV